MSRHNISRANTILQGGAYYGPYNSLFRNSNGGVEVDLPKKVDLGVPVAADDNALMVSATGAELPNNETKTHTFATDGGTSPLDGVITDGVLDIARALVVTVSPSPVATVVVVRGLDIYGEVMAEEFSIAVSPSEIIPGKKAFKSITSIEISSSGDATSNVLSIGFGDTLGLPFKAQSIADLFAVSVDGISDPAPVITVGDSTTPTGSTGDVRGTIAYALGVPDGSNRFSAIMFPDRTSKETAFGINNFAG